MKILVTGSHGFLGNTFVDFLDTMGVSYVCFDRKHPVVPDDIDAVIHFAGLTPLSESGKTKTSFHQANVDGTSVLLRALAGTNIKRFVNIGSAAEYGFSNHPIKETFRERPASDYGKSKLAQSRLVEAFARGRRVKTFNLRIFNVAALPPRRRHPGMRPTIFETLMAFFTGSGSTLAVTNARSTRDYVEIDDVMRAAWLALTTSKGGVYEVVNIASGKGTSIEDLARIFGSFFNKTYTLKSRVRTTEFSVGSTKKAKRLLGWTAKTLLAESVRKVIGAKHRVIIVGAGVAGRETVKEIRREGRNDIIPIGFVDDDVRKKDKRFGGVPVLGTIADLPRLVVAYDVGQVLVSAPSVGGEVLRRVTAVLPNGFRIKILPSASSVLLRKVDLSYVRDIDITDLVGRPLVKTDQERIARNAQGKAFLITGGAGSIGSEIVRQLYATGAKRVVVLDSWEEGIFNLSQELTAGVAKGGPELSFYIGNVRDRERVEEIFRQVRPDVVIHAAAYKHVPLMEANADEARKTNHEGTKNVLDAAVSAKVKDFVLVSTDKAVHPSSVMGRTKREAELLVKSYARRHPRSRFLVVRFGNVLNSSGSVVPTFLRQIRERRPVTVTDFDMTRYFMAIPEAVSLVLTSWVVGRNGQILLLDMGKPIRIASLAEQLIRLHGLEPYVDVPIIETGVRPGEKMHEELAYDVHALRLAAPRVFIAEEI